MFTQNLHFVACGTASLFPHTQHHPECMHSSHTGEPSEHRSNLHRKQLINDIWDNWYKDALRVMHLWRRVQDVVPLFP